MVVFFHTFSTRTWLRAHAFEAHRPCTGITLVVCSVLYTNSTRWYCALHLEECGGYNKSADVRTHTKKKRVMPETPNIYELIALVAVCVLVAMMNGAWARRMLVSLVEAHLLAIIALDVHLWQHNPNMLVCDVVMLFLFIDDVELLELAALCLFLYIDPLGVTLVKK